MKKNWVELKWKHKGRLSCRDWRITEVPNWYPKFIKEMLDFSQKLGQTLMDQGFVIIPEYIGDDSDLNELFLYRDQELIESPEKFIHGQTVFGLGEDGRAWIYVFLSESGKLYLELMFNGGESEEYFQITPEEAKAKIVKLFEKVVEYWENSAIKSPIHNTNDIKETAKKEMQRVKALIEEGV
jgi:hypothetical protein